MITNNNKDSHFKIVLMGNESVGKTSIIKRFYTNVFYDKQENTIGAEFLLMPYTRPNGDIISLEIWDTAGQERYRSLVPMYSRDANIVVIVFDLCNQQSFEEVPEWIQNVANISLGCQMVFVGNKLDMPKSNLFKEKIDQWALESNYKITYTSAKTGENIDLLFDYIISLLPKMPIPKTNTKEASNVGAAQSCC